MRCAHLHSAFLDHILTKHTASWLVTAQDVRQIATKGVVLRTTHLASMTLDTHDPGSPLPNLHLFARHHVCLSRYLNHSKAKNGSAVIAMSQGRRAKAMADVEAAETIPGLLTQQAILQEVEVE